MVRCYCLVSASPMRPPQLRIYSFHLIPARFTPSVPNSYWTLSFSADLSTLIGLNIKFLCVRPDVCRRLPSDSNSQWTPLSLALHFPLLGCVRDLHPLEYTHAGRTEKRPSSNQLGLFIRLFSFSEYWILLAFLQS